MTNEDPPQPEGDVPVTSVPTALVEDLTMSTGAKGLYLALITVDPGQQMSAEWLARETGLGIHSTRKFYNELRARGWLDVWRENTDDGKFRWFWRLHRTPVTRGVEAQAS
jgi:hypothetical protein